MNDFLDALVRNRAGDRCEYCRLPQYSRRLRFQIDHITAKQHGGATIPENLALCCGRCNRHKGPNLTGIDPVTSQIVTLFNPRLDVWADHFEPDGARLVGLTPSGRTTVQLLAMNHPEDLATRLELLLDDGWP
jgi:hypothetical protein